MTDSNIFAAKSSDDLYYLRWENANDYNNVVNNLEQSREGKIYELNKDYYTVINGTFRRLSETTLAKNITNDLGTSERYVVSQKTVTENLNNLNLLSQEVAAQLNSLGYTFISTATPSTKPIAITGDSKVFYIATEGGDYSNFGVGNISELSVIKSENKSWKVEELGVPTGLSSFHSQGSISLYKGISTSSANKYELTKIIPAGKEYSGLITIENNAIPNVGGVYFKDKDGKTIVSKSYLLNGATFQITPASDIKYISFSITDSSIVATGDVIVEIKADGEIGKIKTDIENLIDKTNDIDETVDKIAQDIESVLPFKSVGSISLYKGISTSSNTLYALSQIVPANKEVTVKFTIENNVVPNFAAFFKDSSGKTVKTVTNIRNGREETLIFDRDIQSISFSITDSTIAGTGDIIVEFIGESEINKDISELESEVDILKSRIDSLQSSSANSQSLTGGTLSKEIIQTTRPYYFSQGWEDNEDFGYLDSVLATLPEGKNFLVFSDIHIDYYNNWGLLQKQAMIMKYVHDRLKGCKVLFLGDFIGSQPTEIRAQKEMKWFADEYYSLLGDGFIPVLGDHDTDRVNGGLEDGNQLTEQYIQDTYFKPAYRYGAVSDKAISVIDNLSLTDSKKEAWKNFLKMHYYVDDAVQKIRFIVVQNGAIFREIPNANNISGVNLPFVANAMATLPNDYDCVIVSHEFNIGIEEKSINTGAWMGSLAKLCKSFKSRTSTALSVPYMNNDELIMVFNALKGYYPDSFDFSDKNGNILLIQGDEHIDYAGYVINAETHTGLPISPTDNDFLQLFIDRACVIENKGFPESQFPDKEYVVKTMRRGKSGDFIGTTDEVLFDIATINENTITLTRVGSSPVAGKVGEYEVFDKSKSYSIGDIVTWWGMVENTTSYQVYVYRFIASHIGEWSDNDVEVIEVNKPYIRQYYL